MRTQRARQAVKSNESKRSCSLDPVGAHKYAIHEAYIGMEGVGRGLARGQVGSGSTQVEIAFPDEAFKVEDHRGVTSLWVSATWIRGRRCAAHRSREIEVGSARWWNIDVRDRYRKIAKSRQTFLLRPQFRWNTGAEEQSATRRRSTGNEGAPRQSRNT